MKKIKKLFKKLDNRGSSILLVIVALTFLGVIVAALLTAAGYSYRLKMQDLNSRDNFYYVEQAMNEIYSGVGSQTVEDMKDAYIYTVENMVYYDLVTQSYVTKEQDEVEEMFAYQFINNVKDNENFKDKDKLAAYLETLITNDSVVLDKSKLSVEYEYDGGVGGQINKIIFKNVTLTRTVNYDKNIASGSYTQTISTDIEIGEPDFDVIFNTTNQDYANIFDYSMVADMGIEVHQPSTPLVISGNIYAANDYYNKKYNESTYMIDKNTNASLVDDSTKVLGEYTHGSVTSKKMDNSTVNNTYYNRYSSLNFPEVAGSYDYYDGVTKRSMYSGFYVDDSSVSVMADMMIVPGTIAVMNDRGNFSLYGKNGKATSEAELWADNIVLDGTSDKKVLQTVTGTETTTYTGASIVLRANAYIKDDTELNAAGSSFSMRGKYFGFGDSTEKDTRVFTAAVNLENFQVPTSDGKTENRGHYNSSAIIVNGQQATLDLSKANAIYLAGRSYIELSKDVTVEETIPTSGTKSEEGEEGTTTQTVSNVTVDDAGNTTTTTKITEKYVYAPKGNNFLTETANDTVFIRDYKTGESISLKTNQLAYIPVMFSGMPEPVYNLDVFQGYYVAELHTGLRDSELFDTFFPEALFTDYKIPCVMQEISGKKYYYYDFETAYEYMTAYSRARGKYDTFVAEYPSAQYYASAFIEAYVAELNDENSVIREYLTDIGDFKDLEFDAGSIILPDMNANSNIYSSGAITTKVGTQFNIVRSDSWNDAAINNLLSTPNKESFGNGAALSTTEAALDSQKYTHAYEFSNDLEMEYSLVKWNLGHYGSSADPAKQIEITEEINYIQGMVADAYFGDASITPINKFINIDEITPSTKIVPKLNSADGGNNVLDLSSGYSVWISNDDVTVSCRDTDLVYDADGKVQQGAVRGIIVTKGDVKFDANVTSFEGLIIAGGKVYITENLSTMNASAAICQSVLRECQLLGTENAKLVLNLFKGYEVGSGTIIATPGDAGASPEAKTIDNIDYSDVCKFNNWMKNVE